MLVFFTCSGYNLNVISLCFLCSIFHVSCDHLLPPPAYTYIPQTVPQQTRSSTQEQCKYLMKGCVATGGLVNIKLKMS